MLFEFSSRGNNKDVITSSAVHGERLALSSQVLSQALAQGLSMPLQLDALPLMRFNTGQVVIAAGAPVSRLPVVHSGCIQAVMQLSGQQGGEVVPIQFGPGEIVMLSYLFTAEPSSVNMVASAPTTVRWIDARILEKTIVGSPELVVLLVRFLGQRLREVQARERTWVERSVLARVGATLVRMAMQPATCPDGRIVHATHEEIARRAGVSRPKASLAIQKLRQAHAVRPSRGRIEILQIEALRALA